MESSSEHIDKKHRHPTALIIIDMINRLDFPEGKELLRYALPAARSTMELKRRMKQRDLPIIYVNDNFGQWRSSWEEVFAACTEPDCPGRELTQLVKPEEDDYFVLKPKHSGFYSTSLDILLQNLGVRKLILTGIAGNICVLFTANDAHMRNYDIVVPKDCMASNTVEDNEYALRQLKSVFRIPTPVSTEIGI